MSHHGGWGAPSVLPDPDLSKSTWRLGGNAPWGGWVSHHRLGLRQTMKIHSPRCPLHNAEGRASGGLDFLTVLPLQGQY